ncbi:1,4-alpha-glucan branching protein [Streptomyces sp. NPDC090306]|uniref:maltokinase N-terminal cap-like domain-containing protein n=1 Tax=unclassified Streptomyces TaxID=2593676 RepID=UPI0036EF57FC
MSVVHRTTLTPTKVELVTGWLPSRPWYVAGAGAPELAKAGGFRLDDPEGEVGVEFLVVTDTGGGAAVAYQVPLTYRAAPLDGAEDALVGTTEHGVLGRRWVYDGAHDPVLTAQLTALVGGEVKAQAQSVSDTLDHDVERGYTGAGLPADRTATTVADQEDATLVGLADGSVLRLHRVLRPFADGADAVPGPDAAGHVSSVWQAADGTRVRGLFAVLEPAPGA